MNADMTGAMGVDPDMVGMATDDRGSSNHPCTTRAHGADDTCMITFSAAANEWMVCSSSRGKVTEHEVYAVWFLYPLLCALLLAGAGQLL